MAPVFIIGLSVGVVVTVQSSVDRLLLLHSEAAHGDLGGSHRLQVCLLLILSRLQETLYMLRQSSLSLYLLHELPVLLLLLQTRQT